MSDTITLRRNGIEATVKVGDVAMTKGGERAVIVDIDGEREMFSAYLPWRERNFWYELDGLHAPGRYEDERPNLDIDLAAITAAPPSVPAEKLRAVVERWQASAKHCRRIAAKRSARAAGLQSLHALSLEGCAADILKLLENGNG